MVESLLSWAWWLFKWGGIIFLILLVLDWLDKDELIAEQKRIAKEENDDTYPY